MIGAIIHTAVLAVKKASTVRWVIIFSPPKQQKCKDEAGAPQIDIGISIRIRMFEVFDGRFDDATICSSKKLEFGGSRRCR
jgi:hypothetical protein